MELPTKEITWESFEKLKRQRDELLAALEKVLNAENTLKERMEYRALIERCRREG